MEKNTSINWYPGHMKKTREEIIANLKLVNLVVELLDARAPISSKNPDIDNIISGKPKLVVLTKKDLAPREDINAFIAYYTTPSVRCIGVDATKKTGIISLMNVLEEIKEEFFQKNKAKGIIKKPLRIMIVGIPNVGKSTLINQIIGKKRAKTGNIPGITKNQQWLKIKGDIELLDTPGILWTKIEDKSAAEKLAFLGSIKDEVMEIEEIYYEFMRFLLMNNQYEGVFKEFDIPDKVRDFEEISERIAKKRGFISKGNTIDYFRLANSVLYDFRNGVYGKIQLDKIEA